MRTVIVVLALASACRSAAPARGDKSETPPADTAADSGDGAGGGGSGGGSDTAAADGGGSSDGGAGDGGGSSDGGADGAADGSSDGGADGAGDGSTDTGDAPDGSTWTDPETGLTLLTDTTNRSWADSAAWCAARGATLLSISDEALNARVWEALYDGEDGVGLTNEHTWIGLHDPGTGWAWSDGAALLFTAWGGEVTTDPYGTPTFGQSAAFGDSAAPTWLEAPANWAFAVACLLP